MSTLWVVYIGLYYQGKNEIGNDDLFFHAVLTFSLSREYSFPYSMLSSVALLVNCIVQISCAQHDSLLFKSSAATR